MKILQPAAILKPIIAGLLLIFFPLISEAYVFRVLGVSGKIRLKTGSQETVLKAGTKLEAGQTILLESGYCGLVHSNGKILELKSPGSFLIEELSRRVAGAGKSKVSERYVDYVMGQLSQAETEQVEQNVRKYMDVPGSVHRGTTVSRTGTDGMETSTARVFVFKSNEIRPSAYNVEWEKTEGVSSYTVSLKNRFEETIFSIDVAGNQTEIDFSRVAGQSPDSYTLSVVYKGKKSGPERSYLFKLNPADSLSLEDGSESPAALMLNGIICEEKHFYLDALNFYNAASRLEPGVSAYSEAYHKLKSKMD